MLAPCVLIHIKTSRNMMNCVFKNPSTEFEFTSVVILTMSIIAMIAMHYSLECMSKHASRHFSFIYSYFIMYKYAQETFLQSINWYEI